jgi:hypothetical protein
MYKRINRKAVKVEFETTQKNNVGRKTLIGRVIMLFLCTILLTSCATNKKVMNSWMGAHISNVIQSWGPATRTSSDGKDGTIYTWVTQLFTVLLKIHHSFSYNQR